MKNVAVLLVLAVQLFLSGCRSYTDSTPRQTLEGDNAANYRRVFHEEIPAGVTIVNSVIIGYQWRPGVVTSDDFEFELIVPKLWVENWKKSLYPNTLGIQERKARPIRNWYAPKSIESYETYRDLSSVGYLHLLVDRTPEADGRYHVFFSKH